MQARQDDPIAIVIEQGQGEGLGSAGIRKGVEAHEPEMRDRAAGIADGSLLAVGSTGLAACPGIDLALEDLEPLSELRGASLELGRPCGSDAVASGIVGPAQHDRDRRGSRGEGHCRYQERDDGDHVVHQPAIHGPVGTVLSFRPSITTRSRDATVAKRLRGSRSAHRPGGQGPSRARRDASDSVAPEPASPTLARPVADIDGAVDMVAMESTELEIEERVTTPRARKARRGARVRADSLGARAAAEDAWVNEDLRRIGYVSLALVAGLLIAWVLFVPMDLAGLY